MNYAQKISEGREADMGLVYTNDRCIGCNKCINVCSAIGACVSVAENGKAHIVVNEDRCVACGSCIDVCVHGAREYRDDTERFFADLQNGEPISLLLAPSFKANYPDRYAAILGGLKAMGARRIISVSFGADITTWGYLNYIRKYNFYGGISQPCPALVSYIEHYMPELLPKLFPVQSPLMCAAIYARKELHITDKFAFISPCIAKKLEIDDPKNEGLVQYNVTFDHLMRYVDEHRIEGPSAQSEIEYGLGSFYPTPGGLTETVRWFLGDSVFIRQVEGEKRLYRWLHENAPLIAGGKTPFLLIDALNCERGCICGTGVSPEKSRSDEALYQLLRIREASKSKEHGKTWSIPDTPAERLRRYNEQFSSLRLEDYLRGYTDLSEHCRYEIPTAEQAEEIFESLHKFTEESRQINCTCCGYEGCFEMVTAIHNGFNRKENCIHYEKDLVLRLEVKSNTDLLTGLLNKMSFESAAKAYLDSAEPETKRSLLIVDLDNFKSVNDEHGHQVGDEVLRVFGGMLKNCFRGIDIVGRVGGDEFMALLCGEISDENILSRCDRINAALHLMKVQDAEGFSCSIGVVTDHTGRSFDELYRLADDALYEAKARGKAQAVMWSSHAVEPPEKSAVFLMTADPALRERLKSWLNPQYVCLEAGQATEALNEISLYRDYLKAVYVDFAIPGIHPAALRAYIHSRPMFTEISVFNAAATELMLP